MSETLISLYGSVDKKILGIIIALLVILIVVSLIKKAVKLAIIVCIIIVLATSGSAIMSGLSKSTGISISQGTLHIDNEFISNFNLELNSVDSVVISRGEEGNSSNVVIEADGKKQTIEMPDKYIVVLKTVLKSVGSNVVDKR